MFANFTAETCTGTGTTLALAGALANRLPFNLSFADGDLVAYVVEDSGGAIKVAGIGTYVAATDDITRNDTWNYNGTIIDNNPATNIALSAGTHTVRCDLAHPNVANMSEVELSPITNNNVCMPDNWLQIDDVARNAAADKVIYVPAYYATPFTFNTLMMEVATADATAVVQAGIATCGMDGLPDKVIEIVTVDVTTTGRIKTSLSKTYKRPPGRYFTFSAASTTAPQFATVQNMTHSGRSGAYVFRGGNAGALQSNGATTGVITTPLVAPNTGTDPLLNVMVVPELV